MNGDKDEPAPINKLTQRNQNVIQCTRLNLGASKCI